MVPDLSKPSPTGTDTGVDTPVSTIVQPPMLYLYGIKKGVLILHTNPKLREKITAILCLVNGQSESWLRVWEQESRFAWKTLSHENVLTILNNIPRVECIETHSNRSIVLAIQDHTPSKYPNSSCYQDAICAISIDANVLTTYTRNDQGELYELGKHSIKE